MAIAVDDIIRIRDCQTLFGDSLCNIFYYVVKVWTGNAEMHDILDAFETQVIDVVADLQTSSVTHDMLRGDDLTDGLTFFEQDPDISGTVIIGDTLPSLVACQFRLNRLTKATRPGQKRIAGLSESVMEVNQFITAGQNFTDVEAAFAVDLDIDTPGADDGLLTPVIVGRDEFGVIELGRFSEVSSASAIANVSSQVSRKPGR